MPRRFMPARRKPSLPVARRKPRIPEENVEIGDAKLIEKPPAAEFS